MGEWVFFFFMAALLVASAFFSSAETALFSLQRVTVTRLGEDKSHRARLVARLLSTPRELLTTILFGNLLVNTSFYAVTTLAAYRLAHGGRHAAAGLVGVSGTAARYCLWRITPKAMALSFNEPVARLVSARRFSPSTRS